jgi:hypothetical protein
MPTQIVTIAALGTFTLEADDRRSLIAIDNLDAANAIYVSDESVMDAADQGIRIIAGGYQELNQALGWDTNKTWYIFSAAGATPVIIHVGYSKQAVQVQGVGQDIPPVSPLQEPGKRDPLM